jgi:DNA-binding CsgD family transcriptional regulator/PAS domain-containing protein
MVTAVGADDILLSVHGEGDDSAPDFFGCREAASLSFAACKQVARLAAEALASPRGEARGGSLDWSECRFEESHWQILRLPVRSRRGRGTVVLNLLFSNLSPLQRQRVAQGILALRPMFEGYFRLWQRSKSVARGEAGLRCALQSMDLGVVVVDRLSRIVFSNLAADAIISAGEHLRRSGDRMSAVELRDALALQVALGHAVSTNSPAARRRAPLLSIRSSRNGKPIILSVIPSDEAPAAPDAIAAVIYILDPRLDNATQIRPVCELYGLSPVETRLVCNLTGGASLQEAAVAMRIKEQTARGYLKQVFMKTDTKRQADLVRVMLCSLVRNQQGSEPIVLQ